MANTVGITAVRYHILQFGKIFCGATGGIFIADGIKNILAVGMHHFGAPGALDRIFLGIALLVVAAAAGGVQKLSEQMQASTGTSAT